MNEQELTIEEMGKELIKAAIKGDPQLTEEVLKRNKTCINYQDEYGYTALIHASFHNHAGVVRILVEAGARLDIQNENGWTALKWAVIYNHTAIIDYLKSVGAK